MQHSCLMPRASCLHGSLSLAQQVAGDDDALDFAGAFADLGEAHVAVVAFDRHLGGVAHAAVDLDGLVAGALGDFAGKQLAHCRRFAEW